MHCVLCVYKKLRFEKHIETLIFRKETSSLRNFRIKKMEKRTVIRIIMLMILSFSIANYAYADSDEDETGYEDPCIELYDEDLPPSNQGNGPKRSVYKPYIIKATLNHSSRTITFELNVNTPLQFMFRNLDDNNDFFGICTKNHNNKYVIHIPDISSGYYSLTVSNGTKKYSGDFYLY